MLTIKKGPRLEIRVQPVQVKDRKLVEVREYGVNAEGNWIPLNNGLKLDPEHVDEVIDAIRKIKGDVVTSVLHMADDERLVKFAVVKDADSVLTVKKHLYASAADAKQKEPPDGYAIYRVIVMGGAVVQVEPPYALFNRTNQEWHVSEESKQAVAAAKRPATPAPAAKRGPVSKTAGKRPATAGPGVRQTAPPAKSAPAKRPGQNIRQAPVAGSRAKLRVVPT